MTPSESATVTVGTPAVESAQLTAQGAPRFLVPAMPDHPAWPLAVDCEAAGGVSAEGRVFLDEQLATGDLLLDLDPGFGFLALGAATAPGGVATVMVAEPDADRLVELQDAAANAGAWLEALHERSDAALSAVIEARLEPDARLFVHASEQQLLSIGPALRAPAEQGRLLAVLLSTLSPDRWPAITECLAALGLRACALAWTDAGTVLCPTDQVPDGTLIAVPAELFADASLSSEESVSAASNDAATALAPAAPVVLAPVVLAPLAPASLAPAPLAAASSRLRHGFSFIAPHARTGYGVAGAQLLRALQHRGVAVSYFPMGGVDGSLTDNPALPQALAAQATFPPTAPSVRLSQALDLAMHVGRGPRVGFPIFESEVFSARELHHLRSQDALLVCTPWAREVVRANGLTNIPVHLVPLGADPSVFHPDITTPRRNTDTVFLHVGKLEVRKGQLELLRAFEAAFTPSDPVRLVFACYNPFVSREAFEAQLAPFRASPMARRITLQTTELPTAHDVAALMASADCGVFPARAEGWNLELVEMLAMAKPVIATYVTAHTAYLTSENARLLTLGAPESAAAGGLMGTWGAWGASQHEQLVEALREVHTARQAGTLGLNLPGLATARTLTWDGSAHSMLAALETLA